MVLLIYGVFRGFTRGFIMQLTLLVAFIIGAFAALKLSGFTARILENRISISAESLYIVAMAITFLLVFVGINLVGKMMEKFAENAELSLVNRLLGVIFSVGKVIIITGVILSFVDRVDSRVHLLPKNSREHSLFYKPFVSITTTIFPSLKAPKQSAGDNEYV
jgi:membrane protein required for colicin V production